MVVQRSWKIQSDSPTSVAVVKSFPVGGNSSSDDSNGSNQTTHSIATTFTSSSFKVQEFPGPTVPSNNESFKFVTTPQMAENMLTRLRQRFCPPLATPESLMNSLDLLRSFLQSIFDKEVEPVIKNFMDSYFKPAMRNIKENMGENSVTDAMLKTVVCSLLEESKKKYLSLPVRPNFAENSLKSTEIQLSSRLCAKKPAVKTVLTNEPAKKVLSLPTQQLNQQLSQINTSMRTSTESTEASVRKIATIAQPRRQIFWNTADISANTSFVLDVQANQAFGFGTDGKERLASKHPELIRYLPDGEDRDWLVAQNIISQQNRNSRFLFLIHDEVLKLYQNTDVYKNNPNINLSIMHTFKVPEFMIEKMKVFFVDLNIKSRGLITNSFCSSSTQSSSHLRNALLQGTQTSSISAVNMDPCCSAGLSGGTMAAAAAAANNVSTTTELTATASNQAKPKPSVLSSSHATLTALLNNPNSSVTGAIMNTGGIGGRNSVSHSVEAIGK